MQVVIFQGLVDIPLTVWLDFVHKLFTLLSLSAYLAVINKIDNRVYIKCHASSSYIKEDERNRVKVTELEVFELKSMDTDAL